MFQIVFSESISNGPAGGHQNKPSKYLDEKVAAPAGNMRVGANHKNQRAIGNTTMKRQRRHDTSN
jgi:hypothetical protein